MDGLGIEEYPNHDLAAGTPVKVCYFKLTTNIGSGLKITIDVTLPTREREQIANDVGNRKEKAPSS